MKHKIIIAQPNGSSVVETVGSFYAALLHELRDAGYTDAERSLLSDERLYYGRYLNPELRNYFVETVIPRVAQAASFLMVDKLNPRILDLGCGLGMQSIIFAGMGAGVVGLDVREEAIDLCMKRKAYYEHLLGRKLEIEFVQRNFLHTRPEDFHPGFDAVFSMAAFSSMVPLERTTKLVSSVLRDDARICIYEKNPGHPLHRLRHSPEPSPARVAGVFFSEGFDRCFVEGGCALPRSFWKSARLNEAVVGPANNLLRKALHLSFNYVLGFQRRGRGAMAAHQHRVSLVLLFVHALVEEWSFIPV